MGEMAQRYIVAGCQGLKIVSVSIVQNEFWETVRNKAGKENKRFQVM